MTNPDHNISKTHVSLFFICYLAALGAFASLVNDLYLPTLPQMRIDFHSSRSAVQLGLSFGMIGLGIGELFWGPLSDKMGRKPILFMSLAIFIVASAASIFSPNLAFFNCCRLFQGLGASGGVLLAKAMPADVCQGLQLARLMALIGAINGIAPVASPLFGGLMATSIGWKGIFIVLTAIGLVIFALGSFLKESLPPAQRSKASFFKLFEEFGPLLRNKPFMIHVMLKSAALGVLFSYISAGPFIIQEHFGFSAMEFGLIFGANAVAIVVGSLVCVHFKTMKKAAVTGAAGMVSFAVLEALTIFVADSIWLFEGLIVPMLFFSGIVFASSNTLAMTEGHVSDGSAAAILGLGGYVFGCVVSPLVGMGNILISTSLALLICALISLFYAWRSYKLPALTVQP